MRTTTKVFCMSFMALGIALLLVTLQPGMTALQTNTVAIDNDDIGGVVTGPAGPEAGVWVIAETTDLPTKFSKIVVTDDRGRYVMPDLPNANYNVWVRGYGLIDSPKISSTPGRMLDLKAVIAPTAAAAAEYYPPIYWYSMMKIPAKGDFPLGPMKTQPEWLTQIKTTGCMACHEIG